MNPPVLPLVVGLGSRSRGDDAVGPTVASAVARLEPVVVDVVESEDPAGLIDLWAGRELVVVVDAVRAEAAPGSLVVLEAGAGVDPVRGDPSPDGVTGTHGLGLETALRLARALRRLPPRLVVVGVVAERFDHAAPLSTPVELAVEHAVGSVMAAVVPSTPTSRVVSDGHR